MRLAKDQHLIQALATQRADQTFRNAILPRRSRRDRPVADTHGSDPGGEDMPVGPVVVAHQIGRRRCPRESFGDLPGQPLRRRMPGHLKPQQLSPAVAYNQERKQDDRRSPSAPRTYRWRRSPQRDCEEMSSSSATAACDLAPCISRPSTGRPRTQASRARHGSGTRPTAGFPGSFAGSDHAGLGQSSAALPSFATSSAKTL